MPKAAVEHSGDLVSATVNKAKPKILLSDPTAVELAPQIEAIFGKGGYERVSADQVHAGTTGADIAFVSRDITGLRASRRSGFRASITEDTKRR